MEGWGCHKQDVLARSDTWLAPCSSRGNKHSSNASSEARAMKDSSSSPSSSPSPCLPRPQSSPPRRPSPLRFPPSPSPRRRRPLPSPRPPRPLMARCTWCTCSPTRRRRYSAPFIIRVLNIIIHILARLFPLIAPYSYLLLLILTAPSLPPGRAPLAFLPLTLTYSYLYSYSFSSISYSYFCSYSCSSCSKATGARFRCGGGGTRGGEARLGERPWPSRLTSPPPPSKR